MTKRLLLGIIALYGSLYAGPCGSKDTEVKKVVRPTKQAQPKYVVEVPRTPKRKKSPMGVYRKRIVYFEVYHSIYPHKP